MEKKTLVLTMYGRNDEVEEVSVNQFDTVGEYYRSDSDDPARLYCATINSFALLDGAWVYAQIVNLNQKVKLRKPLQFDIINKLGNLDLQLVIKETSNRDLLRVLIAVDDETREKIFGNMSKQNVKMFEEDMASLHGIGEDEKKVSKDKIIETIQRLGANGNISIPWGKK
jgi:hypothetical protein